MCKGEKQEKNQKKLKKVLTNRKVCDILIGRLERRQRKCTLKIEQQKTKKQSELYSKIPQRNLQELKKLKSKRAKAQTTKKLNVRETDV